MRQRHDATLAPTIHGDRLHRVPDGLRQLVESDDDAEQQPAEQKPGRRAAPGVEGVADAAQQRMAPISV